MGVCAIVVRWIWYATNYGENCIELWGYMDWYFFRRVALLACMKELMFGGLVQAVVMRERNRTGQRRTNMQQQLSNTQWIAG
jgi:hypothetical protein